MVTWPAKKTRCLQHQRQKLHALGDAGIEAVEAERAVNNVPAVVDNAAEMRAQVLAFHFFAVVKGDALGVIAHADKRIAVVAVEAFVVEV